MTQPSDPMRATRRVPLRVPSPDAVTHVTERDQEAVNALSGLHGLVSYLHDHATGIPPVTLAQFKDVGEKHARELGVYIQARVTHTMDLAQELQAVRAQVSGLHEKCSRLERDLLDSQGAKEAVSKQWQSMEGYVGQLVADKNQLEDQLAEARRQLAALEARERQPNEALDQAWAEIERLRSEGTAAQQVLKRLQSIRDSRVPVSELNRSKIETERVRTELSELKALYEVQRQSLVSAQEEASSLKANVASARRERDAARDEVNRLIADRDQAVQQADEARKLEQTQRDLANRASRDLANLQAGTRLTKAKVPILVMPTTQKVLSAGANDRTSADELARLFPMPNFLSFLIELSQAVADACSKRLTTLDLMRMLTQVRAASLDPHFDPNLPLADALQLGVEQSRVWCSQLYQHLVLLRGQLQDMMKDRDTARAGADRLQIELRELERDASDAMAVLQRTMTLL